MIVLIIQSIVGLLALILAYFLFKLTLAFRRFRIKSRYTAAISAPSVSVCVPARNEEHAMAQCLERVLASDYAKMEILVYDDGSRDETSMLVKSFAHAGVRFVAGSDLPEGWLGKNYAHHQLSREASGTYLIFMDVDTFIQPTTISQLVGYLMTENVRMVSCIPGRNDSWRLNVLFGHLRYFWQLIFFSEKRPPAASALWMIERHTLLDTLGSMEKFKSSVAPETWIAAQLGTKAYHCLLTSNDLGVTYEKKWHSQYETSRRLLYPLAGGTWPHGILALLGLVLLNAPTLLVLGGTLLGWNGVATQAAALLMGFMAVYGLYTYRVWSSGWLVGALLWPVVVLQELGFMLASLWGYARNTVTWKGRLIMASPAVARPSPTPQREFNS